MSKKTENTDTAAEINEKLEKIKNSFDENIEAVNNVYETAKELMLRLKLPPEDRDVQVELFMKIQTLKNMGVTAMKMHQTHMEELLKMDLSDGKEVQNGD